MLKILNRRQLNLREITEEINSDLDKLNKIAGRFFKIGSQPKLEKPILMKL